MPKSPSTAVELLKAVEKMLDLRGQAAMRKDAKSQWLVQFMDSAVAMRLNEFRSRISPFDGNA